MKVYATFDVKAAAYGKPMFLTTDGLATRLFVEVAKDAKSEVAKYPADYSLYRIGEYDPNTGVLTGCRPVILMTASAALNQAVNEQPSLDPDLHKESE